MSQEKEDNLVKELMDQSVVKMPFDDFEGRLMLKIYKEEKAFHAFLKDVKLSWLFFIIGTLFGLILSTVAGEMNITIFGFHAQQLVLFLQTTFVIFLLFQFDKLIGLSRNNFNLGGMEKSATKTQNH